MLISFLHSATFQDLMLSPPLLTKGTLAAHYED